MSRVKGARRLRRKLQRLDPEVTKGVKAALQESAELVQRTAVSLVPVDTGNLRAILSEKRAIGRKSSGFKTEFGVRLKRHRRDAFYAHFVEFGTKGTRSGGRKRKRVTPRRAQPFMRPALELSRPKIRKLRDRAVRRALERAARG